MASTINSTSTGSGGIITTGDDSGVLELQTDGVTAVTIDANQSITLAGALLNPLFTTATETATVSATAATGTVNYDVITQSVLYYTTDASGDWTLNVRGDSGTTLNSIMSTGQSLTIAFLVTVGATEYRQTALTVDGSSVTPKWQGGSAPTEGNANSVDIYSLTLVKTADATFTAFEAITDFA